jgi:hypothetical protein
VFDIANLEDLYDHWIDNILQNVTDEDFARELLKLPLVAAHVRGFMVWVAASRPIALRVTHELFKIGDRICRLDIILQKVLFIHEAGWPVQNVNDVLVNFER